MDSKENPFMDTATRDNQREKKRQALLRAAAKMFNQKGYHTTSLEDVAADLGVTKPTIYHYLGNKEAVLLACVRTGLQQLLTAAEQASDSDGNGADRLEFFLREYARINMDDFGRCVIRSRPESLSEDGARKFQSLKREIDVEMRKLIGRGIEDGSIESQSPKLLAFTLAGALNWPARWYDPNGELTPEQVSQEMVRILANGFRPRR